MTKGDDEAGSSPFWAHGAEMHRRAVDESGPLTLRELEARYAASREPAERTRLEALIDSLKDELAGRAAPVDEKLF